MISVTNSYLPIEYLNAVFLSDIYWVMLREKKI